MEIGGLLKRDYAQKQNKKLPKPKKKSKPVRSVPMTKMNSFEKLEESIDMNMFLQRPQSSNEFSAKIIDKIRDQSRDSMSMVDTTIYEDQSQKTKLRIIKKKDELSAQIILKKKKNNSNNTSTTAPPSEIPRISGPGGTIVTQKHNDSTLINMKDPSSSAIEKSTNHAFEISRGEMP